MHPLQKGDVVMMDRREFVAAAAATLVSAPLSAAPDVVAQTPSGQVEVMAALGHDCFYLAGHDRGARTAHRLVLDHPARVRKVALLDIVPTRYVWAHTSREAACCSRSAARSTAARFVKGSDVPQSERRTT
jgi:haloacetate dehalogenase